MLFISCVQVSDKLRVQLLVISHVQVSDKDAVYQLCPSE